MANRLYTRTGFNVKEKFRNISKAVLDIKVKQVDFAKGEGNRAADAINSWVSGKTNGKIDGVVSSGKLFLPQPHDQLIHSSMHCINSLPK